MTKTNKDLLKMHREIATMFIPCMRHKEGRLGEISKESMDPIIYAGASIQRGFAKSAKLTADVKFNYLKLIGLANEAAEVSGDEKYAKLALVIAETLKHINVKHKKVKHKKVTK
jgi:hypothetical protein